MHSSQPFARPSQRRWCSGSCLVRPVRRPLVELTRLRRVSFREESAARPSARSEIGTFQAELWSDRSTPEGRIELVVSDNENH